MDIDGREVQVGEDEVYVDGAPIKKVDLLAKLVIAQQLKFDSLKSVVDVQNILIQSLHDSLVSLIEDLGAAGVVNTSSFVLPEDEAITFTLG